ncbi:PREDICTED: G-protein coupled receptor family C group 6 member A-like [Nanorana parkeri]|uniref:G-protein coupled receptor family C group 6 member A-like n=1 Tax=Nanorana parkeri TaxID=125878 RepID=UPI000854F109|nr:PREDICTED: G-protein coupled receptor family C group 6 member A-like [Nanorana parkeri]
MYQYSESPAIVLRVNYREYRHLLAFIFAIDEINSSPDILPNVTLGYHVYDSCGNVNKATKDVLQILSGHSKTVPNYSCMVRGTVAGFIGDLKSDTTLQMAQLLHLYGYTQLSYGARDTLLSDRKMFPHLFRTVPDNEMQYVAIVKLLKRLKWNWVGIITSDDEYGEREIQQLSKQLTNHGICIEFKIMVSMKNYRKIPLDLQTSTTEVLIICGSISRTYYTFLMCSVPYHSDKTFIIPDSWSMDEDFFFISNCSLVFSSPDSSIVRMEEYVNSITPSSRPDDPIQEDIILNEYRCFSKNPEKNFMIPYTFDAPAPRGRCSAECLAGFRKALGEGYHVCCYDCAPCSEGEISTHSDSENCQMCPEDQWPNEARNICVAKHYEYLSYEKDIMVAFFSASSVIFSAASLCILGIFFWFRSTPIVRANNRNLSFILLFSLMLSFLSVFLFLGHPVDITCVLQQVFFGIVFTVSLSSILAKTIMVFIAFKATRPGSSCRKWVGVKLPNRVLLFCSLIQVMIGVFWMSISPPSQEYDRHSYPGKIIIQCNEGSTIGFYSMLGYMGLLAAVSFVLAFLVRTLPDSFNEAKYITFSMLVFCSVWIAMIPAYLSTRGKYTVAVEIFAILTSSAGILACIFFPKLYILLFKPELNTRKSMLAGRMI